MQCRMRIRILVPSFVFCCFMLSPLCAAADTCYENMRLPKVIQTQDALTRAANQAEAIATHDSISAVFVGGHISQSSWLTADETDGSAHVGRISLTT